MPLTTKLPGLSKERYNSSMKRIGTLPSEDFIVQPIVKVSLPAVAFEEETSGIPTTRPISGREKKGACPPS